MKKLLSVWTRAAMTQRDLVQARSNAPWYFWWLKAETPVLGTVAERKREDFMIPYIEKKSCISRDARIYTIGSCFAREIEEHLEKRDLTVLSRQISVPAEIFHAPNPRMSAILNQYSTVAMLDLLQRGEASLAKVPVGMDSFTLPCVSTIKLMSAETADTVQAALKANFALMAEADCIIITLGQNECWYDRELEIHWNIMPPMSLIEKAPDRFIVRCPNLQANYENLGTIIEHLQRLNKAMDIVLTVSPVPLHLTFSGQDALIANQYNKSVLRVIAEEATQKYDRVSYFPSFEMVTHSSPQAAFMEDFGHVRPEMVEQVVKVFCETYLR